MGSSNRLFLCIKRLQLTRNQSTLPRVSKLYHPASNVTRKQEDEKNEEKNEPFCKSHYLMLANGLISPSSPGMFHYMPLLMRSMGKLEKLIEKLMAEIGAEKIDMPMMTPAKLWKETGRWDLMGEELFRLRDRHETSYCLAPTYEESITKLVAKLYPVSFRTLPIRWYQMTKKFRDERRPRAGLLRGKEFVMKDLYSFDDTIDSARRTYDLVCDAYEKLFALLELPFVKAIGATGNIGGSLSHEFHLLSDVGEDKLFVCSQCDYAANQEIGEEVCPNCGKPTDIQKAIEVGHTFLLGDKYSKVFEAHYRTDMGKPAVLQMGCYGLGMSRLLAASMEVCSTESEIRWPKHIAPYSICLIPPKKGSKEMSATTLAKHVHDEQKNLPGCENEFLLDDRDHLTIGWRIKEARNLGYPYIVIFGKQAAEPIPLVELMNLVDDSNRVMTICELFQWIHETFVFPCERHAKCLSLANKLT